MNEWEGACCLCYVWVYQPRLLTQRALRHSGLLPAPEHPVLYGVPYHAPAAGLLLHPEDKVDDVYNKT